ncbi:MAG: deoxyribose-phosphate aldolase [Bacteroidales bacterium]
MIFNTYTQTDETIQNRIQTIQNTELNVIDLFRAWNTVFSCIDLTTLEGSDNTNKINELCGLTKHFSDQLNGRNVAAVCVYIPFVRQAKELLKNTNLKVATVACAFPSGQLPLHLKLEEVRYAVNEGADEIDMVISRGKMIEGDFDAVFEEVSLVKKACGNAHLKVILETGELKSVHLIRKASEIAIMGGADFIKTSTGKINPAASPEAVVVMLDTIQEYYNATGIRIGLKPAGGISEPETALLYYKLVEEIVGQEWLNNNLFRIGASRLADKMKVILMSR